MVKQITIEEEKDGFTMVEMLIAILISAIVISAVLVVMGYGSRTMSITQEKVNLQNQAKDVVNHISSYIMEGSDIEWNPSSKQLKITKNHYGVSATGTSIDSTKTGYYWFENSATLGSNIYFKEGAAPTASSASKESILCDSVQGFDCEVKNNGTKRYVHVEVTLKNDQADYTCQKDVYLRNQ